MTGEFPFSEEGWRASGHSGFTPLLSLDTSNVPPSPGVYAVLRNSLEPPVFDPISSGGWFKGRDPSVSSSTITSNWVTGATTLYVGKAGTSLSRRLRAYRDFGQGRPVGHWGGRLVWHLADRHELLVCWTTTGEVDPGTEETRLINEFRHVYGVRPFANLRD